MSPECALRSVSPLRAVDVIGLLKQLGLVKAKGSEDGNIEALLGSVFGDDSQEP